MAQSDSGTSSVCRPGLRFADQWVENQTPQAEFDLLTILKSRQSTILVRWQTN
jgi:hypothetical protein